MRLPNWSSETSAVVQGIASLSQAFMTIIALMVAIAVPWWQQRQNRNEDRVRRAADLAGLRLALHTEVGAIGLQCLFELKSWQRLEPPPAKRTLITARFPRLVIYEANANRIGLLTRDEIMGLIGFFGTLQDISVVVLDMETRQIQGADERERIETLLSNACGSAADFLDSVIGIDDSEKDKRFIEKLRTAHEAKGKVRAAAHRWFLM